ncbi:MAG TPA: hypothetical protein PKC98_23980, partial [Candidatus Melainabacteria bacterium]|nr:hypothetical protein [Candidatus Melainabacteria bacterium]
LIDRARAEQDESVRASLYQSANRLLCESEVPVIPLYLATQNILTKPWVEGISFNALDVQIFKRAVIKDPAGKDGAI